MRKIVDFSSVLMAGFLVCVIAVAIFLVKSSGNSPIETVVQSEGNVGSGGEQTSTKSGKGPLAYTLPEDGTVSYHVSTTEHLFHDVSYPECLALDAKYSGVPRYEYNFTSDTAAIIAEGKDPLSFAWRTSVIPNMGGYTKLADVQADFMKCHGDQWTNWYPGAVSADWIRIDMGCEGILEGCGTAQDSVKPTLSFREDFVAE